MEMEELFKEFAHEEGLILRKVYTMCDGMVCGRMSRDSRDELGRIVTYYDVEDGSVYYV